jgi:hypothetical protein
LTRNIDRKAKSGQYCEIVLFVARDALDLR